MLNLCYKCTTTRYFFAGLARYRVWFRMASREIKERTAEELQQLADLLTSQAKRIRAVSRRIGPFGVKLKILHEGGIFGEWSTKLQAFAADAERKADDAGA